MGSFPLRPIHPVVVKFKTYMFFTKDCINSTVVSIIEISSMNEYHHKLTEQQNETFPSVTDGKRGPKFSSVDGKKLPLEVHTVAPRIPHSDETRYKCAQTFDRISFQSLLSEALV